MKTKNNCDKEIVIKEWEAKNDENYEEEKNFNDEIGVTKKIMN